MRERRNISNKKIKTIDSPRLQTVHNSKKITYVIFQTRIKFTRLDETLHKDS